MANASRWKDVTSYSRGEKCDPRSYELKLGALRLVVTRHLHHADDVWVVTCQPFFDTYALQSKDIEKAKYEALDRVNTQLEISLNCVIAEMTIA